MVDGELMGRYRWWWMRKKMEAGKSLLLYVATHTMVIVQLLDIYCSIVNIFTARGWLEQLISRPGLIAT